jgi:hypothetical protein
LLYQLYGLTLDSDVSFPELLEARGSPDIIFRAGEPVVPGSEAAFFRSPLKTAEGAPLYILYEAGATKLIELTNIATFAVSADGLAVVYRVYPDVPEELFRTWVLGTVFGLLLEWRGTFCLHAGAVVVEDECVAFAGFPRTGKSSLLAACVAAGWSLVSDDILPLTPRGEGGITATPGYPGLKLWPDTVVAFVGEPSAFPRIGPGLEKRRVPVGHGWGSFCSTSQPLRAIYVLQPATGGAVRVERLSRREASMALISHSFVDLARNQAMRIRQFDLCAAIARQVPVLNLHVQQDLAQLRTVPNQIRHLHTQLAG